jgi:hypothetical protein
LATYEIIPLRKKLPTVLTLNQRGGKFIPGEKNAQQFQKVTYSAANAARLRKALHDRATLPT